MDSWTYTLASDKAACGTSEDSTKGTCAVKRVTLLIDSRDRDYAKHATPSQYVVRLPDTLYNVTSATLKSAEIPTSYYVFSTARGNTTLNMVVGGVPQTVTVPNGNYSFTTMKAALQTALGVAYGGSTFTVTFDDATYKCTISVSPSAAVSVDTTSINPAVTPTQSCLAWYLGFPIGTTTTGNPSVTGTKVSNLNPETYLLVDIEELNGVKQCGIYGSGGTQGDVFAKIPLAVQTFSYQTFDKVLSSVEFVPPIAKLDQLRVSFKWHDGSLVDFGGVEGSITLELTCTQSR